MHSNGPSIRLVSAAALLACALAATPASAQTESKSITAPEQQGHSTTLEQPQPQEYANPRHRTAGMVLMVMGAVAMATGGALLASSSCGDFCDFGMFAGVGVTTLGGLFMLIGGPLLITGSRRVEPAGAARLLPRTLSLGPTSASARWEF